MNIDWFGLFIFGCVVYALYNINKNYKLTKKIEDKLDKTEE